MSSPTVTAPTRLGENEAGELYRLIQALLTATRQCERASFAQPFDAAAYRALSDAELAAYTELYQCLERHGLTAEAALRILADVSQPA